MEGVAAEEVQARLAGVRTMLAAGGRYDPPGLFAGEPRAGVADLLEEMTATARPASLRAQMSVMAETDQRDLRPHIAVATLLIWGDSDTRSPLGVARQFKDAIPHAALVVIPGAGHVSNLEQPGAFNEAVRAFCREHPPGER